MRLVPLIKHLTQQNKRLSVVWDTRYDLFELAIEDIKTKKKEKLEQKTHDFVIDLVIDKIMFDTETNEYTKGSGYVFEKDNKAWFHYNSENKFLRSTKPQLITLQFEHPQEIERNLNRSRLIFALSINHKGFIRQDIKPSIDEGDAYTLGTHILEKYRAFFQKILELLYNSIEKQKGGVDYELTLTATVSSLRDKTFEKTILWYELFKEEMTVEL